MISMTKKQAEAFRFISDFIRERGYGPSRAEVREALGLAALSGVNRLVDALVERGLVRRLPGRARALEIVSEPKAKGRKVGHNLRLSDFPLNPALIALASCDRADERRSA